MNISTNYSVYSAYNSYNANYTTPQFKAKVASNVVKPNKVKRFIPKMLAVLLPLTVLQCVNNIDPRVDGNFQGENYTVEYFDVKSKTKEYIEQSLTDFENSATNIDFLNGIKIDITKKYENLDNGDAYRRYLKQQHNVKNVHGSNFYSDSVIPKRVCIQEDAHNDDKIKNLFQNFEFSSLESIDFTLMHELGHQFDKYYGHDHSANFAKERDAMLARYASKDSLSVYDMPTDEDDITTEITYSDNSGMSDKPDFKNAYLKDLKNIAQIKKYGNGKLADNINYFIAGIDFNKEINERTVDIHDGSRAEVYANLFSYAVGKNDGDKKTFTQNFKNCYKIVKKDVAEKIGIQ